MALNPIAFTENVVKSFLRYQFTTYAFADDRLAAQMRDLLSLDATRRSPLLKGPYVSLSRPFREGASVEDLIAAGLLHPHMRQRIPAEITHVYGHQEDAIRAIGEGHTTLVSTGTGSGKTECFLYPIISRCLRLRDESTAPGISAVIIYPMNALAEDQLMRLRSLLAGTGITFGMYVGKTPEHENEVAGIRLPEGSSRAEYEAKLEQIRTRGSGETVYPAEELCSREAMRRPGGQPRILLTNVKQLELLLTRQKDVELFADARLDMLVFDEAHTFTGAQGAETACLVRRLRAFCGRETQETVCAATSATIMDQGNPDAAREFASRFFGVPAGEVVTVGEAYQREVWAGDRFVTAAPADDPAVLLDACVRAVEMGEPDVAAGVAEVYRRLAGRELPGGAPADWQEALNAELARSEIAFQLSEVLTAPRALEELPPVLGLLIGRQITEAEILAWLTLGAAARNDGRPLLRPVIHAFVRGVSGAVVTLPDGDQPKLWLAAEDEVEAGEDEASEDEASEDEHHAHLPVLTCTVCGQHYFISSLRDFDFSGKAPGGGEATGGGVYWEPLEEAQGGRRVVLVDRIVGGEDDEDLESHERTATVYLCRHCGALHATEVARCLHCGVVGRPVRLYAIRQKKNNPGVLSSCLSCGSAGRRVGGRYREPAKPVRAVNVADVHVVAQDMVQHSERPRLLVFCDNRQDAAFQAGWMKDHARRFRLRALMAEGLTRGAVSIGDLTLTLDERLEADESLSRALVPEVWQVVRKEGGAGRHEQERRKFLRIQVLREVTLSSRQSIGLEPWGRMKVEYAGLEASIPWMQEQANALGMPAEDLRDGVATVLDYLRRKRVLHDPEQELFSKYWMDGDQEIQQGYLPQLGAPVGTKLRRAPTEPAALVTQWLSDRGDTTVRQIAQGWGVPGDAVEEFLEGMFAMLVERGLLVPVRLKGSKRKVLPNVSEVYQVDADRVRLHAGHGVWRCGSCRRRYSRRTPKMLCPAWRCDGTLEWVPEDPDNYDLQVLDADYTMLRPEEHTAMVPAEERERLENLFKGDSDAVNALVCTPTLELGVDIGRLDAILMRNVPPLPANYWQRAGRAGRRHRMAVDLTYCRPTSHDRAYFADPLKMLAGRVDPPAFNLSNEVMVAKHVHATVIARLHRYARDPARSAAERDRIAFTLGACLPTQVSSYLFADGQILTRPFDLSSFDRLIRDNADDLTAYVAAAFSQGWPERDREVVAPARLRGFVREMPAELTAVVTRLHRRLTWAMEQIKRLNAVREREGTLETEDDALFKRCDRLVKRLKGTDRRSRREAEGYDDTNTFSVLAAEGFLPGYGLEVGSILGTAEIPYWRVGAREFVLPRPPSVALREYVPGNLIYANGNRFVARRFHRDIDEQRAEMPVFEVSLPRQAIKQTEFAGALSALGSELVQAIAVCDVDLLHQSHISDDEVLRFQLGVAVHGIERGRHNGGGAYQWGAQAMHHLRGDQLRLVNVGAATALARPQPLLGYPVCTVCGQSVSPLSSERQLRQFAESHQERCGRAVTPIAFYADVTADALVLRAVADQTTAYSVLEAVRMAAAQVLDMHVEDLQILVIGHVDRQEVDALLWDPMPGGSGLLQQLCGRFGEVAAAAQRIVAECPAACAVSCVDCLQSFRNSYYHKYLDRGTAARCLGVWGTALRLSHDIPAFQPAAPEEVGTYPVNEPERRLRAMLLGAGFPEGIRGEQVRLDPAIGTTTPDVIFRGDIHDEDEGIAVYLDGLSEHIHGNAATEQKDREIRDWLRNNGWDVIEIAVSELGDAGAMARHFRRLAGYLNRADIKERVRKERAWFEGAAEPVAAAGAGGAAGRDRDEAGDRRAGPVSGVAGGRRPQLRLVTPTAEERYVRAVPLVPLRAAAGAFGEPQHTQDENWDWVEVDTGRSLLPGMFVAQVVGHSMEPRIPDGSYCLFSSPVTGTRNGKIVLVELQDTQDPETGERYTVKRYCSEKSQAGEGTWRHVRVTLEPLNPEFEPIDLKMEDEGRLRVVAEFVQVVGG